MPRDFGGPSLAEMGIPEGRVEGGETQLPPELKRASEMFGVAVAAEHAMEPVDASVESDEKKGESLPYSRKDRSKKMGRLAKIFGAISFAALSFAAEGCAEGKGPRREGPIPILPRTGPEIPAPKPEPTKPPEPVVPGSEQPLPSTPDVEPLSPTYRVGDDNNYSIIERETGRIIERKGVDDQGWETLEYLQKFNYNKPGDIIDSTTALTYKDKAGSTVRTGETTTHAEFESGTGVMGLRRRFLSTEILRDNSGVIVSDREIQETVTSNSDGTSEHAQVLVDKNSIGEIRWSREYKQLVDNHSRSVRSTEFVKDEHGNITQSHEMQREFDDEKRQIHTVQTNKDSLGQTTEIYENTTTRDEQERDVACVSVWKNGDGTVRHSVEQQLTYNNKGKLSTIVDVVRGAMGKLLYTQEVTREDDEVARQLRDVLTRKDGAGVVLLTEERFVDYDENRTTIKETMVERDKDRKVHRRAYSQRRADRSFGPTRTEQYVRDDQGGLIQIDVDTDGDGKIDAMRFTEDGQDIPTSELTSSH
ncbi:MAG: hypothetical protein Q7S16_03215 [bacterium]|nr:hypothetical protein [bacterium]